MSKYQTALTLVLILSKENQMHSNQYKAYIAYAKLSVPSRRSKRVSLLIEEEDGVVKTNCAVNTANNIETGTRGRCIFSITVH